MQEINTEIYLKKKKNKKTEYEVNKKLVYKIKKLIS